MVKVDIESAYRLISVHPDDHCLLGVEWKDQVYYDTKLPFGLTSAPKYSTRSPTAWSGVSISGACSAFSTN